VTTIDVTVSTRVRRGPEDVAAFTTEAENDTRWIGGIRSACRLTPGPTGLGTRVHRIARFMGRTIDYVMEVVELEPARRIVMRSVRSPFPMQVTYAFSPRGAETDVSIRVEGGAGGVYRLAGPLMTAAVRSRLSGDLRRLRRTIEASSA
jgi:carbon monoxide dehydrogenase subunit G